MAHQSTRTRGTLAALFLLFLAGAVGCGHTTFDFLSDEANVDSGSGGGSPPPPGSGGQLPVGSGGAQASGGGGTSGGGEGGGPACVGQGCPMLPCCRDIDITCEPFDPVCLHCSRPDQCPPGLACDPLTDQCMAACDDDFECPEHARLCDESRSVCTQCYEDWHCRDGKNCVQGFCVWCDDDCG